MGVKGSSSLLFRLGKDNSLHSTTSVKNGISQRAFPALSALHRQRSLCVFAHSLGALVSSPGARAGTRSGPCPALVGMPRAAGSAGLRRGLQVSPQELQTGKPAGKPRQTQPRAGARCCWLGRQSKAASRGQQQGNAVAVWRKG